MCAQKLTERRSARFRLEGMLTWLGGGQWRELGERHERSAHAVAGAVVGLGAVLAGLVTTLAVGESARWPVVATVSLGLVFALLAGAITRGTASGPNRSRRGVGGRAAVAAALGVVVGELAALVMLSSSVDHRLDERALRTADSAPAVAQASASLQQTKDARDGLDNAVKRAREHQDQALVVARCEYHPTPACPQTQITGIPGAGPETRTANELLADAQHELDTALAARDRRAPELDAAISRQEQALNQARQGVIAQAGRGLGARWVAMNELTSASAAALTLRLATIAVCALLYLLPLVLGLWRGETTHDRHANARADRERAKLDADTAIAIKRAEVRREAEILWAEHQLTQARLAIEAQTEIDREHQRRRVLDAFDPPVRASSQHSFEPVQDDIYLPIAAEAEAASRALAQRPADAEGAAPKTSEASDIPQNLPAHVEPSGEVEPHDEPEKPLIPSIPDATKAAARWIRPLVPPFVARVIDTTTQPLRTARQVFEEVEEITFSLRRTHKVTVDSESAGSDDPRSNEPATAETPSPAGTFIKSSRGDRGRGAHRVGAGEQSSLHGQPGNDVGGLSLASAERESKAALAKRKGPRELPSPEGPRQLPPGE